MLPIGPQESRRLQVKVVGHIIESDTVVQHYTRPVATGTGPEARGMGGADNVVYGEAIPDGTIIEIVTTWEVAP